MTSAVFKCNIRGLSVTMAPAQFENVHWGMRHALKSLSYIDWVLVGPILIPPPKGRFAVYCSG